MALTSAFYDGYVTESVRAQNRGGDTTYGVYGPTDFKVTAHPSIPFAVLVKAGRAFGYGVTDVAAEDQVVQCGTLSGTNTLRWDLIVVRRNWQPALGGPSTLEVIEVGTSPAIPGAPTRKVGPGVEDDQPIALVQWNGGMSAPFQIVDLRVWTGDGGGLFAVEELVRSYLKNVGTRVNILGADWVYELGENGTVGWVRRDQRANTKYGFVQPDGYSVSGGAYVEQMSGRKQVTLNFSIKRTDNTAIDIGTGFSGFGAILPDAARGNSDDMYLPVSLSGGSNNGHATVFIDPSTGNVKIKGVTAFTWTPGALFSINVTYFI